MIVRDPLFTSLPVSMFMQSIVQVFVRLPTGGPVKFVILLFRHLITERQAPGCVQAVRTATQRIIRAHSMLQVVGAHSSRVIVGAQSSGREEVIRVDPWRGEGASFVVFEQFIVFWGLVLRRVVLGEVFRGRLRIDVGIFDWIPCGGEKI